MLGETPFEGSLVDRLSKAENRRAGGMSLFWLGQAGFLIEAGGYRVIIDPYLSDSLGAKYAGSQFPHERMMAPPLSLHELEAVDLVMCTHRHTDHMDPGTLQPLCARLPGLRVVVPAAEMAEAASRTGAALDRLIAIEAGARIELLPGLVVTAVRAAHETLETDDAGRHRFLGYGLTVADTTVFHSGDTVPFAGQREEVAALKADLALLPVNGRSPSLLRAGFAGNMTLEEAVALCRDAGIPGMIAHHYGMFAFNTVDPADIDGTIAAAAPVLLKRASLGTEYRLKSKTAAG